MFFFFFQVDFEVGSLWDSLRNAWSVNAFLYHGHLFYFNDGVCGKGELAKATYFTLE